MENLITEVLSNLNIESEAIVELALTPKQELSPINDKENSSKSTNNIDNIPPMSPKPEKLSTNDTEKKKISEDTTLPAKIPPKKLAKMITVTTNSASLPSNAPVDQKLLSSRRRAYITIVKEINELKRYRDTIERRYRRSRDLRLRCSLTYLLNKIDAKRLERIPLQAAYNECRMHWQHPRPKW